MKEFMIKHSVYAAVFILVILFFTTLPSLVFSRTTTDSINITLTVDEAVVVPPPPPGGGGGPLGIPKTVEIFDVTTRVATSTATVFWKTTRPAISVFSWGTTTEYSLGKLSEIDFTTEHQTILTNLTPDTQYFFRIEVDDVQTGRQGYVGTWRTLPLPDERPPANVSNFEAVGRDDEIGLFWENPPDKDFDLVRIVRSEDFFPLTPFEGKVVYEGRGTQTTDADVVQEVTYYYSAFALDESGNPSEGSIALGRLIREGIPPVIKEPFEEFPPAPEVHPLIEKLRPLYIDFIQDGKKIPHVDLGGIPIDGSKDLTISIDYERLPEILKTIGFTIHDPEDSEKTFSFLLRVDDEKKTYKTVLAPFVRSGVYVFRINILDHKNQGLKKLDGQLLVAAVVEEIKTIEGVGGLLKTHICFLVWTLLMSLLLFVTSIRLYRNEENRGLNILIFILIIFSILISILFREMIGEQLFCLLLLLTLLLLTVYLLYRLVKRVFKKESTTKEELFIQ